MARGVDGHRADDWSALTPPAMNRGRGEDWGKMWGGEGGEEGGRGEGERGRGGGEEGGGG